MTSKTFLLTNEGVKEAVAYAKTIIDYLQLGDNNKDSLQLATEETIVSLQQQKGYSKFSIDIVKFLGKVTVHIKVKGHEYQPWFRYDKTDELNFSDGERELYRLAMEKCSPNRFTIKHKNGINYISINTDTENKELYMMLSMLIAGTIFGLLMAFAFPPSLKDGICKLALEPIFNMFMSALKLFSPIMVFFSLSYSIATFSDANELGRISVKTIIFSFLLMVVSIGLAFGTFAIPYSDTFTTKAASEAAMAVASGTASLAASGTAALTGVETPSEDISVLKMITSIIPESVSDITSGKNMSQIIFIAILLGLAAGRCSKNNAILGFLSNGNELFMTAINLVMKTLPIIIFSSIALMIATTGNQALITILNFLLMTGGACLLWFLASYGSIAVFCKLNPITFFKKFLQPSVTTLTVCSSIAVMPLLMETCEKKFGIHKKISTFVISLGTTICKCGNCIYMTLACLFIAKLTNYSIPVEQLPLMVFSIIVYSLASAPIPCASLIFLTMLLSQIGIPLDNMSVAISMEVLTDAIYTLVNVTGIIIATILISSGEKQLDTEVYNSQE